MGSENFGLWLFFIASLQFFIRTQCTIVGITYVREPSVKGAVCLDGSPPAYHLSEGLGAGVNNWLIQLEGGGWCSDVKTCVLRRDTRLGSSKAMATELAFSGLLSNQREFNPDFYNWNRIKIRYCDGSSFTGDVEAVDPATNLHFRGKRIFRAVIDDLLAKGMKNAKNAILSGCSAGGLGSILHCDIFKSLLPPTTKVKCVSDAGYFVNVKDVSGAQHIEEFFSDIVATHGSARNLPVQCTSKMKPELCFFPQNVIQLVRTPIFIVNAAYDSWQVRNILVPGVADPRHIWNNCKNDIKNCSSIQLETLQGSSLADTRSFLHSMWDPHQIHPLRGPVSLLAHRLVSTRFREQSPCWHIVRSLALIPTSEENEAPFIKVWKPLPTRRVLKTLKGNPKRKAQKRTISASDGVGPLHLKCLF